MMGAPKRAFGWLPRARPHWLYRQASQGKSMPIKINDTVPIPLSPDDWMNVSFVAIRISGILGFPPSSMTTTKHGSPEMIWFDPEEEAVAVVLHSHYDSEDQKSRVGLHISDGLSEGNTLALIGLCTLRDASWDFMSSEEDEDDEDEIDDEILEDEPDVSKPRS